MKRLLAIAALLPLSSCLSFGYMRFVIDEPVPDADVASLRPGATTLAEALSALGAPTQVYEYRGDGAALLWRWLDRLDWGLTISAPVFDRASASFDLDLTDDDHRGVMLWFGPDLVLERYRQGRVGELMLRRSRPAIVE